MLDIDMSYSSRGTKVQGPERVAFKTADELIDFVKASLVVTAKDFLKQEQKSGFFPEKDFLVLVDGKLNKKEESAKAFGKIEYVTKLEDITEVVLDVMRLVVERSPTVTGYYQSTNVLMFNGNVVAKGLFETNSWLKADREYKPTDRFRVINMAPYAIKLERLGIKRGTRGKKAGKKSDKSREKKDRTSGNKVLAPNGAYWLAKNTARRRFPQLKDNIQFNFIPLTPSVAAGQNTKSFKPSNYKFAKGRLKDKPYLYPSISISIKSSSFSSNSGFTQDGAKV